MKEVFAPIYDTVFGIYSNEQHLIFQHLYDKNGYVFLGLVFVFIPLIFWLLFYHAWKNPYAGRGHWLAWLLVTIVVVGLASYGIANVEIFDSNNQELNDALADPGSGFSEYASQLPLKYGLVNALLGLLVSLLFCLVIKRSSKVQAHLPV